MLRARKYRFALCFRVLSNQYVERSAYANVFKFNRERETVWESQSNLQMFPLVSGRHVGVPASDGLQHGVSILNPIIFSETLCCITRVRSIAHPRNFGTLFIYYSSTIFQFLDSIYWMVSDLIFTCVIIKPTCVTWKPPTNIGQFEKNFIWGDYHCAFSGRSVRQPNAPLSATLCWRDPTRSKQLFTVAIGSITVSRNLSCRCPVKHST